MRLLIDLQGLQNGSRNRGIGRYVTSLTRGILRHRQKHEVRFLLNNLLPETLDDVISSFGDMVTRDQFVIFDGIGPTGAIDKTNLWRSAVSHELYEKFVADLNPDILLIGSLFEGGSDNTVVTVSEGPRGYLVAAILYDLIPLLNPHEYIGSKDAKRWYFGKVEKARRADLLLGISASACREAIEHLPSDRQKVIEIGAAASEEFTTGSGVTTDPRQDPSGVLAYYGITKPFIMHTSAYDRRKNFSGLVRAYALLPDDARRAHQLVLVCKLSTHARLELLDVISQAGLNDEDVVLTGFVPDDELRILYAQCALFVFPSFHEGFGLPVVEAMWCGAPAIGSNLSSVPEVIGREDALFDPYDPSDMARQIHRALTDIEFRQALLGHAARHARTFNWDDVALRALEAMETRRMTISGKRPTESFRYFDIHEVIARIAQAGSSMASTDKELMRVAQAMEANELVRWPTPEDANSGISKTSSP